MVNMPPKITPDKNDADNEKKDDKDRKDNEAIAKIAGSAGPNKWNKAIKKVSCNKVVSIYFVIQHLL